MHASPDVPYRHATITARTLAASVLLLGCAVGFAPPAQATLFQVTNLVSDDAAANPAVLTDASLVNAWGISRSGASPFWVSDNGSGVSTLYRIDPATNAPGKLGLTVTIPGAGSVTGQVFNGDSSAFNGDAFLFVSEDGTISGWRNALGSNAEVLQTGFTDNVYKGAASATIAGNTYLYAANFRRGAIDVVKGSASAPDLTGSFTDPVLPSGYAPFNIQNLGDKLYVTYAKQDAQHEDDAAGPGNGFVDVFDLQGNFIRRIASQDVLNSPWGLAIAPSSFGELAGDLLVGNFGDGLINVFDPDTGAFEGALKGGDGKALVIDGLWGLMTGNGGNAGSSDSIYFSAGPDGESHGLFGVLAAIPGSAVSEPAPLSLLLIGLLAWGPRRKPG